MEKILHTVVEIGLEKPFKVLHITDTHITESNEDDSEKMQALMKRRKEVFLKLGRTPDKEPQEHLKEALALADAEGAYPVLTGDLMDANAHGSRIILEEILKGRDYLYTAGSHEGQTTNWLEPMEEADPYYKEFCDYYATRFGTWFFDHKIINGVNLVTMDDAPNFFTEDSYLRLQGEINRGLPIVLFMHNPLNCTSLQKQWPYCSDEAYEISRKTVALIESCPLIKAVFAGHWHTNDEYPDHRPPVYVTGGTFTGTVRMIEIQ